MKTVIFLFSILYLYHEYVEQCIIAYHKFLSKNISISFLKILFHYSLL